MKTIEEFKQLIVDTQPIDLFEFKEIIPELEELDKVVHGTDWHQEGSVLVHSNMVMAESLKQMSNLRAGFPRIALYLSAMLHDFGKPETATPKPTGGFSFHGHEKAGVWKAKEFIKKYFPEYNYRQRDTILNLVEFSGHPRKLIVDEADDARLKRLSLEVPTHILYNLEMADFRGRIGKDIDKALIQIEQFKKRCEDLNIYGTGYQIPNVKDLTNLQYSIFRWNILTHYDFEDDQIEIDRIIKLTDKPSQEMTMLVGAPASGKSTFRQSVTDRKVICMDDIRKELCGNPNDQSKNQEVFQKCLKELNRSLKNGENVVLDNTNFSRKMRKLFIDAARSHGAQVGMVYFDLPIETLLKRNLERQKVVPEEVVWRFYKQLETPSSYEYERLTIIPE